MNELQIVTEEGNDSCVFCMSHEINEFKFGPLYKRSGIVAHYYCVLFSHKLLQNGADYEGFLGFLIKDIKQELQRISKVTCCYCLKQNASVCCWDKRCKKNFHFPCGYSNKTLNQFKGLFKTFCYEHRPKQRIPQKIMIEAENNHPTCIICYDLVDPRCVTDAIWAPCCFKTWYHRDCIQRQALSAGYFFKCAACNNDSKFKQWVETHGIFVPSQDASWELEPNAFSELETVRHECDAANCFCPYGRRYFTSLEKKKQKKSRDRRWIILLCKICASQGTHLACADSKLSNLEWICDLCVKVYPEMSDLGRASKSRKKSNRSVSKADDGRTEEKSGDEGNASTSSLLPEEPSRSKGSALGKSKKKGAKRKRKRIDVEDGEKSAKKKAAGCADPNERETNGPSGGDSNEEVSSGPVSEAETNVNPLERPPEDIIDEAAGKGETRVEEKSGETVPVEIRSEEVVKFGESDNEVTNVDLIDLTDCTEEMTEEEKHSVVEVYRNFQLNDIKYRVKKEIYDVSDGESSGSELEIILEKNGRNESPKNKCGSEGNGKKADCAEEKTGPEPGGNSCSHRLKKELEIKDKLLKHYFSIVDQASSLHLGKEIEKYMKEWKKKKNNNNNNNNNPSEAKRKKKRAPEKGCKRKKKEAVSVTEVVSSGNSCDSGHSSGNSDDVNDVQIVRIVASRKKTAFDRGFDSSQQFSDSEEEIIDIE